VPEVTLGQFQHFAAEIRKTEKRKPRIYISGPMSHLERKNIPAFMRAQSFFERMGYEVLNPAINERRVHEIYSDQAWNAMSHNEQWQAFMDVDEELVRHADLGVGFERGAFGSLGSWQDSRGAKLEHQWIIEDDKPWHSFGSATARKMAGKTRGPRRRAIPQGIQGSHQKASARYWLDVETQGLRTHAKSKIQGIPHRRKIDRLRMSQISFGREVKPGMVDFIYGSGDIKATEVGKNRKVFTDIITEEMLKLSNTTPENALNDELLKRLTKQDMKGYWDVGVFVEGNPLREGLQRHVQHVLAGRKTQSEVSVVEGMVDSMLRDVNRGTKVELAGWNVGFDWSRIQEAAAGSPKVSRKLRQLQLHKRFTIKEAAEPVFEMTWNLMKRDRDFTPRFTDKARLEQLVRENKNVRGAIVEHEQLRSFMDIVAVDSKAARFDQFHKKFKAHLNYGESDEIARDLAQMMGTVETYGEYRDVVRRLKGSEDRAVALRKLFDRSYKPTSGRHVSLMGIAGRDESVLTTGFNFTLGWRQENVVKALADLSTNADDQKMLKDLMEAGLHDSDIDTMTSARISKMLEDMASAGPNDSRMSAFVNATLGNEEAMAAGFLEDIKAEEQLKRLFQKGQMGPENINLQQARSWFDRAGIKKNKFMAIAGVALGGLYLLGEHNRGQIEGIRRPVSQHDWLHGIEPSMEGSDFGSGRNIMSQLMGVNYFSKAPQVLTKSQEHIWDMTQFTNAMKYDGPTMRAVDEGAVSLRESRQALIESSHLADNEMIKPWQKLAEKAEDIEVESWMAFEHQRTRSPVEFPQPQVNYTGVGADHRYLADTATDELLIRNASKSEEWAKFYSAAKGIKPTIERHNPLRLVNDVPREMAKAVPHLQAGHAGYVQNLGRMARRSHLRDQAARLTGVNPVMAQFRHPRPRTGAVRSRMET
jgi:hypothetical protein